MSTTTPSFLTGIQTALYFNVAGLALWVYDYFLTLEAEMKWYGGKKWDATRVCFVSARYLPFFGAIFTVYMAVGGETGDCNNVATVSSVIHLASFFSTEVLLIIRTYAFWQCDRRILVGLLLFGPAVFVGAVIESRLVNVPDGLINPGNCIFVNGKDTAAQYGFLVFFEIVLLCMTLIRRASYHRSQAMVGKLLTTLFRDGVLYMCCIISITLINIIAIVTVPVSYINFFVTIQLVMHSILASRILFNLRQSDERPFDSLPPVQSIHFAPRATAPNDIDGECPPLEDDEPAIFYPRPKVKEMVWDHTAEEDANSSAHSMV